jgi:uncharacterized protein YecE (DUF72 family)
VTYRVGCSGWDYPHWKDAFYPHGLRQSSWFQHYASIFDTVEINNSFYRTPTDTVYKTWQQQAPAGFAYTVKVNRAVTQFYKLGPNSYSPFEEFVRGATILGPTMGPLLLQLPPSLGRDDRRLEAFLALPPIGSCRIAIEFRKADWFAPEVYAILREHGIALAVSDLEGLPIPTTATAPWVYARFHGAGGKYQGSYSDEQLRTWSDRLQALAPEGYVYFNNDAAAAAPGDALRMRDLLNR